MDKYTSARGNKYTLGSVSFNIAEQMYHMDPDSIFSLSCFCHKKMSEFFFLCTGTQQASLLALWQ